MFYFSVYHAHFIEISKVVIAKAAFVYYVSSTPAALELYFSVGMGTLYTYEIFSPGCFGLEVLWIRGFTVF
jgi:hypothetical protein